MAIKGIFYVRAQVADLARSKRFYGETLGWKINTDEANVAGFAFGNAYLVVLDAACVPQPAGAQAPPRASAPVDGLHVAVQVEDVDAEHARLKRLGLEVGELRDQPWGERSFSFRDPDGHEWSYGQATAGHR